jgi:hypothetical protein
MFIHLALASLLQVQAQALNETLNYTLNLHQQSCRRAQADEPFLCSSEPITEARLEVVLNPAPAYALENEAFEGESADVGMTLAGGRGQYLPKLSVRKSVAAGEAIYTLRLRSFQFLSVGKPNVYETVYISPTPPSEPLLLMGDRQVVGENRFQQVIFTLIPSK